MAQSVSMRLAVTAESVSKPNVACGSLAELTGAMTRGNEEAYRHFFTLYAHRIFLYHLALTRAHEETAKELLQQTMIRVAKYIKVFHDEEIFWSWLRNLARSCWIDEHRKKQRYWNFLEIFRKERRDPPEPAAPERLFETLIAELEPDERALLEDKYLHGLSIRDIAEARGSTEKAIESRLSRLRQKLKEKVAR
jgi:RNA polymerase sigma-70 factor (ECF subfamily)